MEETAIVAKDPKVTALLDCCRSILGDNSIRVLAVGATKMQEKCLYCVVKNSEITDIYLRTESKEVIEPNYHQESETIHLLSWNEERKKYISPNVYNFHCLSRLLAEPKANKAIYEEYRSLIRSLSDDTDGGKVTKNEIDARMEDFLAEVRRNFFKSEVE